ncbi:20488_t:CDS:2 [Rhizophagus irregularis]|nr:20488_t:CDS:2 [Rhizophagus irregularis]
MSSRNNGQRRTSRFVNMTNNVNNIDTNQNRVAQIRPINNSTTIDRIARMTTPQITNNPIENDFFNGTSFYDNNNFESLILPTGCSVSSSSLKLRLDAGKYS